MNNLLNTLIAPPPPSELDELISRDPSDLSALDIDKIIALQHQHRAKLASGTRVRKTKDEGPSEGVDLTKLGLLSAAPMPTQSGPTSTSGGGMRR